MNNINDKYQMFPIHRLAPVFLKDKNKYTWTSKIENFHQKYYTDVNPTKICNATGKTAF